MDSILTSETLLPSPAGDDAARKAWLEKRRSGIGGSDAAAVLGLSPWKSPLALWAEKTGKVDEPNLDELEYIEWGQVLEEPIARKYAAVTGRSLIDPGRFAIRQHPERDFMHCTLDRIVAGIDEIALEPNPGDLSIKNVGFFKASEWEDEAPLPYQVQLSHELAVTGLLWGSFAVLIGGQKFRWLDFPRNDRFISFLIEKEEAFWDLVRRDIPPMPDASDSTREVLLRLYPKDTGASRELPPEAAGWMERRRTWKEAEKSAQAELQEVENLIKAAVGEASIGLIGGTPVISWKHQHREPHTVAACDFRVLREVKKGKKQL